MPDPSPVLLAGGPPWPGDWSSFWPDMVIGCLTGLIIGLALWLLELWTSQRHSARTARRVSLRIVQPLLLILQRPSLGQSFNDLGELPRKHRLALEVIEGSDLDDWHEERATELTEALRDYRTRLRTFHADADDLEQAVDRWFTVHRTGPVVREWTEARLLGASPDYLRMLVPEDRDYDRIAEEGESAVTNRIVRKHARAYRQSERRADNAVARLLPILIQNVRERAAR
ncbi:hypothetical protein [Brachybacterium huguangmaarense]